MRVFIDIGSHFGECIFKALNPALSFDLILAYEPSSFAASRINLIKDKRVEVNNFALGSSNEQKILYGSGLIGASIYSEKKGNSLVSSETIMVKNASQELGKYITPSNVVFLKLNCEGSEIEILQNLNDSGLLNNIDYIYVDWDARKILSLQEWYLEFRKELLEENYNIVSADKFPVTGWLGVEMWLEEFKNSKINLIQKIKYKTFSFLPFKYRFKELFKFYSPNLFKKIYKAKNMYLKIGVNK